MTGQLWPGRLWPTLLAEAWSALSGESGGAGEVRLPAGLEVLWVSGAPGGLPSRLPAEDVALACAGAALLAAAALHAQRGGDSGSRGSPVVRLDRGHVAAAFRSEAFLRVNGQPRPRVRAAVAVLARRRRLGAHARQLPLAPRGAATRAGLRG